MPASVIGAVPSCVVAISSASAVEVVDVRSLGAQCNGVTDDTAAIQAAVNLAGPHTVYIPPKVCKTTDTITVAQPRVQIWGNGKQTSRILFVPTTAGKPAFTFSTGINAVLYQNAFKGVTIYSTRLRQREPRLSQRPPRRRRRRIRARRPRGSISGNASASCC